MMNKRRHQGFTLIEMIVVIVITGIIGAIVAIFIRAPVQGYVDSARRAELTDIADTALRRVSRDLRTALPNSVRVTGAGCATAGTGPCYIEFIPTTGGGRYRAGAATIGATPCGSWVLAVLDFDNPDICFEVLGLMPTPTPQAGDFIVVYNMGEGQTGANAYSGVGGVNDNRRVVSAVGANSISITSAFKLPHSSCVTDPTSGLIVGGCRFQVVQTAVTYACDGAGNLLRWNYPIQSGQPTSYPGGGTSVTLASNVTDCRFAYAVGISQSNGLVTMHLSITEQGETVAMYAATHVNNVP